MEEWKCLTYRGEQFGDVYEVSNQGKIRNKISGHVRKLAINKQGYKFCVISRGRSRKIFIKIHRAVAENFVKGNNNGLVINHKDGNKLNNLYSNLEFVTTKENNEHARKMGLHKYNTGSSCYNAKLSDDEVRKIREIYSNGKTKQNEIAKMFNLGTDLVCLVVNRKTYENVY